MKILMMWMPSTSFIVVLLSCFITTMASRPHGAEHFMWACRKHDITPSQPLATGEIARLLHNRGLEKYDVPADGKCLYHAYARAVAHLINSGNKVNANIEDLTVEKLCRLVNNSVSDFSLKHVGVNPRSASIIAEMIAEEGSSNEWGGLSAITILAKQHCVRVDVYDEIGDHVQQV